jgi:hypothetical protein
VFLVPHEPTVHEVVLPRMPSPLRPIPSPTTPIAPIRRLLIMVLLPLCPVSEG